MSPLVAGVDSSTQSVKVVIRDADSGEFVASSTRAHPDGSEVEPLAWKAALDSALEELSGHQIAAISIFAQQHGLIPLDSDGQVIRRALLWNDTRSDQSARELNDEINDIHLKTGSRLVASFTASKLRWLADHEPENTSRISAIALPHDWLSWRIAANSSIENLFTDRSDASGTGYFDPVNDTYLPEIIGIALRNPRDLVLPRVVASNLPGGETLDGALVGSGGGDNAGAAFGIGAEVGDLVISLGTSGTAFAVSTTPTFDATGEVAGFADATGHYLPLACTLNAAKVIATTAASLNLTLAEFDHLASITPAGAEGLRLIPHFDGERTPNRPCARGNLLGISHNNLTIANIARATMEGVTAGLYYAARAIEKSGIPLKKVILIGGGAKNSAIQQIFADFFQRTIVVPRASEYVADGAARQAAWILSGNSQPPSWAQTVDNYIEPKESATEIVDEYLSLLQ